MLLIDVHGLGQPSPGVPLAAQVVDDALQRAAFQSASLVLPLEQRPDDPARHPGIAQKESEPVRRIERIVRDDAAERLVRLLQGRIEMLPSPIDGLGELHLEVAWQQRMRDWPTDVLVVLRPSARRPRTTELLGERLEVAAQRVPVSPTFPVRRGLSEGIPVFETAEVVALLRGVDDPAQLVPVRHALEVSEAGAETLAERLRNLSIQPVLYREGDRRQSLADLAFVQLPEMRCQ